MTRHEILLKAIYKSIIGIEIEDHKEYCDYVEKILKKHEVSYTYGSENPTIFEIRFHLTFEKFLTIVPILSKGFKAEHPRGHSDPKAGSMHVHVDVGTQFIPTHQELKANNDVDTFMRIYNIVDNLKQYMKRNFEFRTTTQSGGHGGLRNHLSLMESFVKYYGGHTWIGGMNSKGHILTYNESGSGKKETLEIRINEVFPLWYPVFMLMVSGYSKVEALRFVSNKGDICSSYCNEVFRFAENCNNTLVMKSFVDRLVTKEDIACVE